MTAWISDILENMFTQKQNYEKVADDAIRAMRNAKKGDGKKFNREELYAERLES